MQKTSYFCILAPRIAVIYADSNARLYSTLEIFSVDRSINLPPRKDSLPHRLIDSTRVESIQRQSFFRKGRLELQSVLPHPFVPVLDADDSSFPDDDGVVRSGKSDEDRFLL